MKKRTAIIIFGLIALIVLGYYYVENPLSGVKPNDYNDTTQLWTYHECFGNPCTFGTIESFSETGELLKSRYATSWLPNDDSEIISISGCGLYIPYFNTMPDQYYGAIATGKWCWEAYLYEPDDPFNPIKLFPKSDTGGYDTNYLYEVNGLLGWQHWDPQECIGAFGGLCGTGDRTWYSLETGNHYFDSINFKFKGPVTGYLYTRLVLQGFIWDNDMWVGYNHCGGKNEEYKLIQDWAEVYPGGGSIEVQPNPFAPPGYNLEDYFEENQEVTFKVDTGIDGTEGENWFVYLYNANGNIVTDGRTVYDGSGNSVGTFPVKLGNNLAGVSFSFYLKVGDFDETTDNIWKLKLWNSITDVAYDDIFVLYEGGFDDIPGPTSVIFLSGDPVSHKYYVGDTVDLKASAVANNDTGRDIEFFKFRAHYQDIGGSTYFVDTDVTATKSGNNYLASLSFTPTLEGFLNVDVRAYDTMHLPGPPYERVFYIFDEQNVNYATLTVLVKDNQGRPVYDAFVSLDVSGYEKLTDSYGMVQFANIAKGRYTVTAEKAGYGRASTVVNLQTDDEVTLELGFTIDLMTIGIAIIVFAIVALAGWFLPIPPLHKKILIILGVVLAILVYLMLSGMLIWIF